MFSWIKRGLLVSTALLSIGLVTTGTDYREVYAEEPLRLSKSVYEKPNIYKVDESEYALFHAVLPSSTDKYIHRDVSSAEVYTNYLLQFAYDMSMLKFGETISKQIEKPFQDEILPKLSEVVAETTNQLTENEWKQVKLSSKPTNGSGEKIFHLYNEESGEDIFRFHVRRDQPPKKGHWFNFHYHTFLDGHEGHHNLGDVYWGKNMPPKWMA
ncbi:hypothetical protein AJ85_12790 [Alkalihalobacillus alcalophilus ATCC 27647 = CGMCC 1.3604]|uniref:Cell division protein FtsK n=1 Tax=Alkalihalobacillus alcalophilus ATCC 27647 = CGMCC 1.3604 TaxID=1218173 RepID=A0A094WMT2_ALKAL|nr:YpjP family protein [Alkalihalobacillus alcalophilus]KGA99079.1 hypothetical protein BALCAV_0200030 [Alkalihalobacillus alcalophilus ATCC 27647 = CGMCC 1.3604]MED1562535.1 YpjP family protein [Alkalihalobacillus alcalophilus]THG90112.1 hypothetical protein AJ85_12790 [Alkalihalobacillus alcalophilus ATCC 27647 = CGMCC 1.3604]